MAHPSTFDTSPLDIVVEHVIVPDEYVEEVLTDWLLAHRLDKNPDDKTIQEYTEYETYNDFFFALKEDLQKDFNEQSDLDIETQVLDLLIERLESMPSQTEIAKAKEKLSLNVASYNMLTKQTLTHEDMDDMTVTHILQASYALDAFAKSNNLEITSEEQAALILGITDPFTWNMISCTLKLENSDASLYLCALRKLSLETAIMHANIDVCILEGNKALQYINNLEDEDIYI